MINIGGIFLPIGLGSDNVGMTVIFLKDRPRGDAGNCAASLAFEDSILPFSPLNIHMKLLGNIFYRFGLEYCFKLTNVRD